LVCCRYVADRVSRTEQPSGLAQRSRSIPNRFNTVQYPRNFYRAGIAASIDWPVIRFDVSPVLSGSVFRYLQGEFDRRKTGQAAHRCAAGAMWRKSGRTMSPRLSPLIGDLQNRRKAKPRIRD
jgi:hypothetical protein